MRPLLSIAKLSVFLLLILTVMEWNLLSRIIQCTVRLVMVNPVSTTVQPTHVPTTGEPSYPNSVIAFSYWEKMTMGTQSMFSLVAVAKQWKATVVFPFTGDSYLYGLPTGGRRKLDLIYDTWELNRLTRQFDLPPMIHFKEFLTSASRKVIYVEIGYNLEHDSLGRHIFNVTCSRESRSLIQQLNAEAQKRNLTHFYVTNCCRVLAMHANSPQQMKEYCGMQWMDPFTVAIDQWRGHEETKRFRIYMPDYDVPYPGPWIPLPHSKTIMNNSMRILTTRIKKSQKFIGIHLRSEKVWIKCKRKHSRTFTKCFQMVYNLSKELASKYLGLPVIYFGDGYTYKVFGSELSKRNIKLLQFEFSSEKDQGFQAQVEQRAVARAEVLVLVGGGSFQFQIYTRYRVLPNSGLVYRVCDDNIRNYLSVTKWMTNTTQPWFKPLTISIP